MVSQTPYSNVVMVAPEQQANLSIALQQRQLHIHVGGQAPSSSDSFPGSGSYPQAPQNDTLQALIDRKLERSAVTGMRDLVLWFENKLA